MKITIEGVQIKELDVIPDAIPYNWGLMPGMKHG